MNQRVDFITFATTDLDAVRRFYRDGLGWSPLLDVPGEIVFFQVGHGLTLGLFDATKFAADMNRPDEAAPISGITLSHNVESPEAVRATVAAAVAAGATMIKEPQGSEFGGFHAHFADPNGIIGEI